MQTLYCAPMNNRHLTGLVGASCLQSDSVDEQEFASRSLPILTTSSCVLYGTIFGSVGLDFME